MTLGVLLGAYLPQVVNSFNSNMAFLQVVSPFDRFLGNGIVNTRALRWGFATLAGPAIGCASGQRTEDF